MKYSVMQLKDFKIKSMDASVRASIREELLSEGFNLSEIELLIHCITNKPDDQVIIGGHQVMFRKSYAELKGFITLN